MPDHDPTLLAVGRLVERFRTARGWTSRRGAMRVQMSPSYLGEIEQGARKAGEGILLRIAWRWRLTTDEQRELFLAAGIDDLDARELPPDRLPDARELDKYSSEELQRFVDRASAIRLRRLGLLRDRRRYDLDDPGDAGETVSDPAGGGHAGADG